MVLLFFVFQLIKEYSNGEVRQLRQARQDGTSILRRPNPGLVSELREYGSAIIVTDLIVEGETEVIPETEEPTRTHIIDRGTRDIPASALVTEARIYGLELTALCGFRFVPEKDPLKHPPCEQCVEIFEFAQDFRSQ